jgi:hypothetical protein
MDNTYLGLYLTKTGTKGPGATGVEEPVDAVDNTSLGLYLAKTHLSIFGRQRWCKGAVTATRFLD